MATVRTICTGALQRLRVLAAGETPSAEDVEVARAELDGLIQTWPAYGMAIAERDLVSRTLDDEVLLFVPFPGMRTRTFAALSYKGAWNAATNSPPLASGAGTEGDYYAVSVAGATLLDGWSAWAAKDYLVFDGLHWRRCPSWMRFNHPLELLLAEALSPTFGKGLDDAIISDARDALLLLQGAFVLVDDAIVDTALRLTTSRLRQFGGLIG